MTFKLGKQAAELSQYVQLHTCDAAEFLSKCTPSEFDFIFLDADRKEYAGWAPLLFRTLRMGIMVVDNATSHPAEMSDFRAFVDKQDDLDSLVLPIGKGQLVIRRRIDDIS